MSCPDRKSAEEEKEGRKLLEIKKKTEITELVITEIRLCNGRTNCRSKRKKKSFRVLDSLVMRINWFYEACLVLGCIIYCDD